MWYLLKDFIEPLKSGASSLFPNWELKIKLPFDHQKISWAWAECFPFEKYYQNVKKNSLLSKNSKWYRKTVYITSKLWKRLIYLLKKWIYIDLSICLDFHNCLTLCHALKEITKTIFRKTFKNFAVLDTVWKSRIVTISLRWLRTY